jgi:hypothetical protein
LAKDMTAQAVRYIPRFLSTDLGFCHWVAAFNGKYPKVKKGGDERRREEKQGQSVEKKQW